MISPYRNERRNIRSLVATGEFIEVFVDTPIDVWYDAVAVDTQPIGCAR